MAKPAFAPSGGFPVWWTLASASYVLIGLIALAVAGAYETRRAAAALTTGRRASRPGIPVSAIGPNLKGTR
jgi:hypothetical protein